VTPNLQVTGVDHVVINTTNVERSLAFYCDLLGLAPERVDEWRRKEVFFPSVRVDDSTIIDLLEIDRTGENMNHLCLTVRRTDFDAIKVSGAFDVVDGPDIRSGARGDGMSLYVRDPDANIIELRYYL
jgi:catechol 2,3-dioxygenase-like lactoylglutathione lyase family enzyme